MAFKRNLIQSGEVWMNMIKGRNQTSHTYDEATANEIVAAVTDAYFDEFKKLEQSLTQLKEAE